MDYLQKIITNFELHSVEGIRDCFKNGINPNAIINGKPLVYELINMYTRGPLFKSCIQAFVDNGLDFEDKILLSVLLDNDFLLDKQLAVDKSALTKRYSFNCTFTPLFEVSLLHICAEYNHLSCAKVLVKHGADINSKAGFDENGFGGHTPIFHTVNQDSNKSLDILKFLISKQADLTITVKGLIWGKGYEWETFVPSVNPISYAMMGLLRQFQRSEKDIYEVVSLLIKANYGIHYFPTNIPNKYLNS
ncbi:ankyrin repeat domain-containing protein [Runella sp. MFBS21]|uniref:ankyrin repeat domain-containing protein n=1 Tax=Runella sp. MFBS21 TaxID=3034018 RepID=UPI0023F70B2D|nr:ankyrin repeat domain-containing protein [Runella sp. MFBS21]MDF7818678.1 ankyrin repeat domain-containing protein [Runella sp. MFBS21]